MTYMFILKCALKLVLKNILYEGCCIKGFTFGNNISLSRMLNAKSIYLNMGGEVIFV